jgi:hypothetical protein
LDSGQGAEFFEDAVVEVGAVFVFGEGLPLQVDVSGDDVVGGESAIEGGEIGEAFCEESGDEQKRGAGEDLGPDEGAGLMRRTRRAGRTPKRKDAPTVNRIERQRTVKLTVMDPVRGTASAAYPANLWTAKKARATPRVPPSNERRAISARAFCRR